MRVYLVFVALIAILALGAAETGDSLARATRTRAPTPTEQVATATPTEQAATATPTEQATRPGGSDQGTSTPTEPPPPSPTNTPTPSGNLLVNGDFAEGFFGWNMANGHWTIHDITGKECAEENPDWPLTMAQMDRDRCERYCNNWPIGAEDWLWQDVAAPAEHASVVLTLTEAHHMYEGNAEVRIYGSADGSNWTLIWERLAPDAEFGAGKFCKTPPTFSYTIDASYPFYRLAFYGKVVHEFDGWIFGPLSLTVQ